MLRMTADEAALVKRLLKAHETMCDMYVEKGSVDEDRLRKCEEEANTADVLIRRMERVGAEGWCPADRQLLNGLAVNLFDWEWTVEGPRHVVAPENWTSEVLEVVCGDGKDLLLIDEEFGFDGHVCSVGRRLADDRLVASLDFDMYGSDEAETIWLR